MRPSNHEALVLWPDGAPGALGQKPEDAPTITCFFPEGTGMGTGASMVVLPGGGFTHLATHEGQGYAEWLNRLGIAAFVVQYRLASHGYGHPAQLQDATRAVRYVRARAAEWDLRPDRIGIIGSSAGGHTAGMLMTHFDAGKPGDKDPVEAASSRPDVGVLCYAAVSAGEYMSDAGRERLLGKNPSVAKVESISSEKHVKPDTPPAFLWHTWEDGSVPVEHALMFASALREAGVKFDLHVYGSGGHGLGLGKNGKHAWTAACIQWLHGQGFIPSPNGGKSGE